MLFSTQQRDAGIRRETFAEGARAAFASTNEGS